MQKVRLGNRWVGSDEPCLIIAEAGVNHEGSIDKAKLLADIAKQACADIVKFQVVVAENVISAKELEKVDRERSKRGEEPLFDMIKRLELKPSEFRDLKRHCDKIGIEFAASFIDTAGVDLLEEMGVKFFKLASGELTNHPLLRHVAMKRLPIILSTGMATLGEVADALDVVRSCGNDRIALLHCVSAYPADIEDINLDVMATLRTAFQVPVGYSDHTLGPLASLAAASRGASIVEKHLTFNRQLPGADHAHSSDAEEFSYIVRSLRSIEKAFGHGLKLPAKSEHDARTSFRRSVVARVDIPEGNRIAPDMLTCKRPATGIAPRDIEKVHGRVARRPIARDEIITWDMI